MHLVCRRLSGIAAEANPSDLWIRHVPAERSSRWWLAILAGLAATAAIGGTSLFGGRGHPLHAVLGGIVIAAIVNGMALLGLPAAVQPMATALVLLTSITVDVVVRRRGETAR